MKGKLNLKDLVFGAVNKPKQSLKEQAGPIPQYFWLCCCTNNGGMHMGSYYPFALTCGGQTCQVGDLIDDRDDILFFIAESLYEHGVVE